MCEYESRTQQVTKPTVYRLLSVCTIAIALTAFASCKSAREYRPITMSLDAACDLSFGYIGGIRELSDRRVIVADPLGVALMMVDFAAASADTLARIGAGPEEYRQPDRVLPLPGDSTLLVDLGNARLMILDSQGVFTAHIPIAQHAASGTPIMVVPRFTDGLGRFYFLSEGAGGSRTAALAAVARFDRATLVVDTLATIALPDRTQAPPPVGGQPAIPIDLFEPRDDWAVAIDGSLATVNAHEYAVRWISALGDTVLGPITEYDPVQLLSEDREQLLLEVLSAQLSMRAGGEASGIAMWRGSAADQRLPVEQIEWPDALPAFRPDRAIVSPDNFLWIEQYTAPDHSSVVDLFDRRGVKQAEVQLPQSRRVVGFGAGVVYMARVDQVGLEWLERYVWTESTAN